MALRHAHLPPARPRGPYHPDPSETTFSRHAAPSAAAGCRPRPRQADAVGADAVCADKRCPRRTNVPFLLQASSPLKLPAPLNGHEPAAARGPGLLHADTIAAGGHPGVKYGKPGTRANRSNLVAELEVAENPCQAETVMHSARGSSSPQTG